MPTIRKTKSIALAFYSITAENEDSGFYPEYNILAKTVDSINSFNFTYKAGRLGEKGPATHCQQDLYRAMLVFACAGLDVFVKQLIKNKLPQLILEDKAAENMFKTHIKRGINKDEKEILNIVALALIDRTPRDVFLNEYIKELTDDSLQSFEQLCKVSNASGLETTKIFNDTKKKAIKDAFDARNQIIHEMDINVDYSSPRTRSYRTRRQRVASTMEKHTKDILNLAVELLAAYKAKYERLRIGAEKKAK